ncbi:MAG: DinB family protein [Dehalococcoidia bacterium]
MAEDRDELIRHYEGTRAAMRAALEGLTPAQMAETSLDGWSIKDHLLHLASWDEIRAGEVRRISKGFDSAWRMSEEQDEVLNAMAYELRRHLSLEQAFDEFESSRAQLLAALRDATERGLDASLYGAAGLRSGHEEEHTGWIREWRARRGI